MRNERRKVKMMKRSRKVRENAHFHACMAMTMGWSETNTPNILSHAMCARDECDNSKTDYEDCNTTRTLTCSGHC